MAMTTFYEEIRKNKLKSAFLVSGFILVILFLGYFVGLIWGREAAFTGLVVATVVAIIMSLASYYHSDKIALASVGARPVTREEYPYYVNTVEGLALAAGIPTPRTYIIETPAMNAFATGRNPEHAAIAVTTGLLERCNRLELEGVIAHEISHIKNYDIRLMSMVVVLVGLVVLFSEIMLRSLLFGGGRRRNGEGEAGPIYLIILLLGLAFLVISPIVAQLLQLAISRRREFLADANAALLTRYPEGLASALEKLTVEAKPFPQASNAVAHLFIVQPFRRRVNPGKRYRTSIWDTHPPVEERIRRLRAMAGMSGMRGPEEVGEL